MSNRVQRIAANTNNRSESETATPLNSVMSDLTRLSQSFVNSYQDLEGQVEELNGQLKDIDHERSEAIEEKLKLINENQTIANRLQNLLAILPSGVVVLDGQGHIKDCNAVAVDMLGRPLIGESWLNVIKRAFMPQADDGHQISLKDNRKIHIETRALDREPGQMIVLTDMTKTRQLQAELSHQQKLSSMGKMLASLAHQIRTPLSAAILYSSHLKEGDISAEKKQEFSLHLFERLKFMDRQINDMLDFVKGERKQKKQVAISELVATLQQACVSFDHNVQFQIDPLLANDQLIAADLDALAGALTNLVENAIHATRDNSPVMVKIRMAESQLEIRVIDYGKGISPSDRKKIFEPFYTTKNNGNGLGLAIVQGVIIDHAGQISVTSKPNKGSCFKIGLALLNKQNQTNHQLLESARVAVKSQEYVYGR